jgi:hypothetical protein
VRGGALSDHRVGRERERHEWGEETHGLLPGGGGG